MNQSSKRTIGLTERRNRIMVCQGCPNRVKAGDSAGINRRDYCDWDKKRIRNKVKDSDSSCPKGIWPVYVTGSEPQSELGLIDKAGALLSAVTDIALSNYVSPEIMESRRAECLTCFHRIPKSDSNIYDSNAILETDICGICTCPVLSMTKLSNKFCPDNPSKWGKADTK